MRYSDIVRFGVRPDLSKRLGYTKVLVIGKDLLLEQRVRADEKPQIIMNRDPGVLINAVKDINVIGIAFEGDELIRRVLEKAAEYRKIVFIPIGQMTIADRKERGPKLGRLRKIAQASRKAGATVRVVTLANSDNELLSRQQLVEVGKLLLDEEGTDGLFGDIL